MLWIGILAAACAGGVLLLRGVRLRTRVAAAVVLGLGIGAGGPALARQMRDRAEAPVVSNLYLIAVRQAVFRDAALVDVDRDGRGEYGGLVELHRTEPPLIHNNLGAGLEYGYRFYIILDRAPDANEQQFYAYAVPERYGVTGRRAVYVDESQVVRIADAGPTALVTRQQALSWAATPLTFAESLR